jgi:hypothetical protein
MQDAGQQKMSKSAKALLWIFGILVGLVFLVVGCSVLITKTVFGVLKNVPEQAAALKTSQTALNKEFPNNFISMNVGSTNGQRYVSVEVLYPTYPGDIEAKAVSQRVAKIVATNSDISELDQLNVVIAMKSTITTTTDGGSSGTTVGKTKTFSFSQEDLAELMTE